MKFFMKMKKKIIVTGFFIGGLIHCKAQNIGLSIDALSKYMPLPPKGLLLKSAKLYLPQVREPLVNVQQNIFYSQHFYPQTVLNPTWERHYAIMNRHLLLNHSPKELFIDRVAESLIANLFEDN
ncbi:MAG: hypothetical protein RL329_1290 [Bacteroidota bacterium]|jgi:hypothetical protein